MFLTVPVLLSGCSTLDSLAPDLGLGSSAPSTPQTSGLVVSDEPFAAQSGAAVLAQGGSAADAVSAMFFTMTATYPVAAGLGGGGICLVRDAGGQTREFDFLPRAAAGGGAYAVPGAVAGFYDLQKAFGTLPWQRVVAAGEAYAAAGFPISHVLEQRLQAAQSVIRLDAALSAEFLDESGHVKPEGTVVMNRPLSVTLGTVRLGGGDGFYKGPVATAIAAYSAAQGGHVTAGELAAYRDGQTPARLVNVGGFTAAIADAHTGAGAFAGALLANLSRGDATNEGAVVAALRQTLAGFHVASLPSDLGATGFAALDKGGGAAACAVTLNGPFGSGHTAGDTGVLLAAAPDSAAGLSAAFLAPVIASDSNGQVALSGAGAGGPNGTAAAMLALERMAAGMPLAQESDLRSTGLAPFVTVNVISCQNGICVALPDPGGHGLGTAAADQGAPAAAP